MTTLDIYIDASCNHIANVAVAGMYIPMLDQIELREYYENCKSTIIEIMGAEYFISTLPEVDNLTYIIHTDCQKIADSGMAALNIPNRQDVKFVKEIGHGKTGVVNPDFKKIDKITRQKMRTIVANKNM